MFLNMPRMGVKKCSMVYFYYRRQLLINVSTI